MERGFKYLNGLLAKHYDAPKLHEWNIKFTNFAGFIKDCERNCEVMDEIVKRKNELKILEYVELFQWN